MYFDNNFNQVAVVVALSHPYFDPASLEWKGMLTTDLKDRKSPTITLQIPLNLPIAYFKAVP